MGILKIFIILKRNKVMKAFFLFISEIDKIKLYMCLFNF